MVLSSDDVQYDVSATIGDATIGDVGTPNNVYVSIVGTAGSTEEFMCPSGTFNIDPGTTVTCTVSSPADIGNYTCVTWRLDGSDGLNIAEFTTSIDGVEQATISPVDGWLDDPDETYSGYNGNNGQTATWCAGKTVKV